MSWRPQLVRFAACGAGGAILALPLDLWMHAALPDAGTLAVGVLGGGIPPLLLAPAWGDLPRFLSRGLDAAVAAVGVLVVTLLAVVARGPLYMVIHRDELVVGTVAVGLLAVAIAGLVETHRRLAAVIADRERELAESRQAAVEAQLRALQAQIQPHFLFNTFNALSELIHVDADAAEDLVTDLAHLLRYSLRSSAEERVPLADELAATRRYLRIEQARLGDRLRVELELEDDVDGLAVPGLVLQPLVENAVRHGVAPRPEGGTVTVRGRRDGDHLLLEVQDDGPGVLGAVAAGRVEGLGAGGHGGGLANVRRRLALRFGERASMSVDGNDGTHVTVRLPLREEAR